MLVQDKALFAALGEHRRSAPSADAPSSQIPPTPPTRAQRARRAAEPAPEH